MSSYDLLFIVAAGMFLVQTMALYIAWRMNPTEHGPRDWVVGAGLASLGTLVVGAGVALLLPAGLQLAGVIANHLGTIANCVAWYFYWRGTRRFLRHRSVNWLSLPVVTLALALLVLVQQPLALPASWSAFSYSVVVSLFAGMLTVDFWAARKVERRLSLFMQSTLLVTALIWGARAWVIALDPHRFHRALFDSAVVYVGLIAMVMLTFGMILLTNARLQHKLRQQAAQDPLTGAINRRALDAISGPISAHAHRHDTALGLAMIDLDHFKRINDNHGHPVGDDILRQFANLTRAGLREGDLLCRYGGEEFLVLLPGIGPNKLTRVMERLRERIASQLGADNPALGQLTISIGTCHRRGEAVQLPAMIADADAALYRAKGAGRNRVEAA